MNISWKSPKLGVLHVVECSGRFVTFEEASRHLHVGRTFAQELEFEEEHGTSIWDEGGAMKVLIASASSLTQLLLRSVGIYTNPRIGRHPSWGRLSR